ncbi:hypothetical protein HOLleu_04408 [Holothuria leucospilota]|uniref:Uncharacterized protein n=1 Tax=Holothuria leucospilota TaxID=206669 RepID=A0A9Q1CUH0_HOLLE|nr:hypothetical protein HOLleu_04408 [Holothuria leucospilota]
MKKTYDDLVDIIVREQILSVCNRNMSIFIREKEPKTLKDLTTMADRYSIVHGRSTDSKSDSGGKPFSWEKGHVARNGRQRYSQTAETNQAAALELDNQIESVETNETKQEEPQHTVNACLGICANECGIVSQNTNDVNLLCEHEIPLISVAATESDKMILSRGFIEDREVSVLRDSRCSTVRIRRSVVGDEQLTGNVRKCVLNYTVRDVPEATVCVCVCVCVGAPAALCMNNPLYDLALGNVQGVRNPWDPDKNWQNSFDQKKETCAVETRAMIARQEKPVTPLKVVETLAKVASKEDISNGQYNDKTLDKRAR